VIGLVTAILDKQQQVQRKLVPGVLAGTATAVNVATGLDNAEEIVEYKKEAPKTMKEAMGRMAF
jgi:hypothetical protein